MWTETRARRRKRARRRSDRDDRVSSHAAARLGSRRAAAYAATQLPAGPALRKAGDARSGTSNPNSSEISTAAGASGSRSTSRRHLMARLTGLTRNWSQTSRRSGTGVESPPAQRRDDAIHVRGWPQQGAVTNGPCAARLVAPRLGCARFLSKGGRSCAPAGRRSCCLGQSAHGSL
jgi:hypothetical protein